MLRFVSLVPLAACAVDVVLAAPQAVPTPSSICDDYMWGVIIEKLNIDMLVYNQYIQTTACAGPAWVQSSMVSTPPSSITPWGTKYNCQVPEIQYYCGETPVATCCGNSTISA